MARQAPVTVNTCTWCWILNKQNVLGTIPIPVTWTELEGGGFTFTYDPSDIDDADAVAWGCEEHGGAAREQMEGIRLDIHENIIEVVQKEEEPEEDDTPEMYDLEGSESHGDEPGDEEGTGEPPQDSEPVSAAPVGEKVTPSTPAQPNATPDTPKTASRIRADFEPDMSNPKEEERKAIRLFWKKGDYAKKGINAPGFRGTVSQKLLRDWRTSDEYFNWKNAGIEPTHPANA